MRALLQKAPHNAHLSKEYDEIIDEFKSINQIRNDYVHGVWMVQNDTRAVFF